MSKKEISLKLNSQDFIKLVNSGKIKISSDDLDYIKKDIKLNFKPKIESLTISIPDDYFQKLLKKTINNCLLNFQLC